MSNTELRFAFGKSWLDYLDSLSQQAIESAVDDLKYWLSEDVIRGKRVVDMGSGSGLHSLAFNMLGAAQIVSVDYDNDSVTATSKLHQRAGAPEHWNIMQGSVLDEALIAQLGTFDIVYSWGVLHHTGAMWHAVDNAIKLLAPDGVLFISLYTKHSEKGYQKDLATKKRFHHGNRWVKRWMISRAAWKFIKRRIKHFQNPFTWNEQKERGMNRYHDIVDWLGGLPYETATEEEVLDFGRERGLVLEKIRASGRRGCSIYVFRFKGTEI